MARLKTLMVITLVVVLAFRIGMVGASIMNVESTDGNYFEGWTADLWTQTTYKDFESGNLADVVYEEPGDVLLDSHYDYVYGLQGNTEPSFWRYDVSLNSWSKMAIALGYIKEGGSLTMGVISFLKSGTIESQVLDTTTDGTSWDLLQWDEVLESETDIFFWVRASDKLVDGHPDATWIKAGGTSGISSGLPSGRYMQWKAELRTSDDSVTPILEEVRVYYS